MRALEADAADAGCDGKPPNELGVVIANGEGHPARQRLSAVVLGDRKASFAFDEACDEVALSGLKQRGELQHDQIFGLRPDNST